MYHNQKPPIATRPLPLTVHHKPPTNDGSAVHELVQLTNLSIERIELVHNFEMNLFIRSFNELWLDELWNCDELMTFVISIKLNASFPSLPPKSSVLFVKNVHRFLP